MPQFAYRKRHRLAVQQAGKLSERVGEETKDGLQESKVNPHFLLSHNGEDSVNKNVIPPYTHTSN